MDNEKWERLIFLIEERCKITARKSEEFEVAKTASGQPIMGQREFIEFESPLGKMKLEKNTRPKVIDKKVLHTKRIGGRVAVDYIYSPEESISEIKVYQWDKQNNFWREVDLRAFNF